MEFLFLFLSLAIIITIILPIGFMRLYRETKNTKWIFFITLCYLILILSLMYLRIFEYIFTNFKISIGNPILEIASIFIVLVFGIYYLKSN
jgi:hypothetical protein